MTGFFKKSAGTILITLLIFSQAFSFSVRDDQKDVAALADGFAVAMAKKDKMWMDTNFTNECLTYVPSGQTLNKQATIQAFTGGVYDIKKSTAENKSFMISDKDAGGSADYTVEGTMPDGNDISGTYKLSFKFKKTDAGWKISEILVNGE